MEWERVWKERAGEWLGTGKRREERRDEKTGRREKEKAQRRKCS
jgi:hypothetical protein